MRVAIVHDYLNQRGGAGRVVAALHEMFPEAPIFTSIVDRTSLWPELMSAGIRPSWMQHLPGLNGHFKKYLLFPTEGYAESYGRVGSLLEVGTGFPRELTGRDNIYLNGAILV